MAVAGIKANGKARTSKGELESLILGYYHERIILDLNTHSAGIATNFTVEIIIKLIF